MRQVRTTAEWLLIVLSPRSVEPEWVQSEVNWALEHRQGRIFPCRSTTATRRLAT